MLGWMKHKQESILLGEINNLRYADDTTLMAESKEELKSLLMKVKEESEKAGLKLNIPKAKIMASSPITSWQIDGETVETVTDFMFWGAKSLQMVTAACQASLFIANSWSLLKLISIKSVMLSNHLILCRPLLLTPSIFPSIRSFQLSQLFASGGQRFGASASVSVLPMNI